MITTTATLYEGWANRHDRAVRTLQHAGDAPALFKPERVEELRAEAAKAEVQYRNWLLEDMGR